LHSKASHTHFTNVYLAVVDLVKIYLYPIWQGEWSSSMCKAWIWSSAPHTHTHTHTRTHAHARTCTHKLM
jgi:hypothetical protein